MVKVYILSEIDTSYYHSPSDVVGVYKSFKTASIRALDHIDCYCRSRRYSEDEIKEVFSKLKVDYYNEGCAWLDAGEVCCWNIEEYELED